MQTPIPGRPALVTDLCPPMPGLGPEHERRLMQQTTDQLLDPANHLWGGNGPDMLICHRDFLRSGRKVYQLAPDAEEQLSAIPAHWPEGDGGETWCLRFAHGRPAGQGVAWYGAYVRFAPLGEAEMYRDGEEVFAPLPGAAARPVLTFLLAGVNARGQAVMDTSSTVILSAEMVEKGEADPGEGPRSEVGMGRLLVNAVAAILDQRVSVVVAHPRHGREGREYQRRGIHVSTLRLSADGLHTWRTTTIGPPDGDLSGGTHAPPCAHLCRAHTAIRWVRDREDLDPDALALDDYGFVLRRGRLVALRVPVREHVRGSGEATPRVTRIRSDR